MKNYIAGEFIKQGQIIKIKEDGKAYPIIIPKSKREILIKALEEATRDEIKIALNNLDMEKVCIIAMSCHGKMYAKLNVGWKAK